MSSVNVLVKLANVSRIFEAAMLLQEHGLLGDRDAASMVREYVNANPDINEAINKEGAGHVE